jgi:hypothetical protein
LIQMKKWLIGAGIAVVAIGLVVGGAAFAASQLPEASARQVGPQMPFSGGRMGGLQQGGRGFAGELHTYVFQAVAESFGLTAETLETELAGGKGIAAIAQEQGVAEEDLPALLEGARAKAIEAAVADGVLTQEQADWMANHPVLLRRFAGMRGGWSDGGRGPMGGARFGAW